MVKIKNGDVPVRVLAAKCQSRRCFLKNMIMVSTGIACASFPGISQGAAKEMKMLVIYFSHSGNTYEVAREIQAFTGSQIAEIKPANPFPTNHETLVALAEKQAVDNFRPAFTVDLPNDFNECGIIFLGFPIWAYTMPMIIYSFLDKYHFAGRKIAPFSTHEGSGLADAPEQIARLCPDAEILPGLAVRGRNASHSSLEVKNWLGRLGIIK